MRIQMNHIVAIALIAAFAQVDAAAAQSSSLYMTKPSPPQISAAGRIETPQLADVSYTAVFLPPPREYQVHDLVTVIIRENSTASSDGSLETEKDTTIKGAVNAFPSLNLYDLISAKKLTTSDRDSRTPFPEVDLTFSKEFEGEGAYERQDTMTTRLTARVVDVKPNGTLALEARTFIKNDEEEVTITVTGYARPTDVTIANTVLSTQMFDLRVAKTHEGEIRKAQKKGLFTKILDTIFNF